MTGFEVFMEDQSLEGEAAFFLQAFPPCNGNSSMGWVIQWNE